MTDQNHDTCCICGEPASTNPGDDSGDPRVTYCPKHARGNRAVTAQMQSRGHSAWFRGLAKERAKQTD